MQTQEEYAPCWFTTWRRMKSKINGSIGRHRFSVVGPPHTCTYSFLRLHINFCKLTVSCLTDRHETLMPAPPLNFEAHGNQGQAWRLFSCFFYAVNLRLPHLTFSSFQTFSFKPRSWVRIQGIASLWTTCKWKQVIFHSSIWPRENRRDLSISRQRLTRGWLLVFDAKCEAQGEDAPPAHRERPSRPGDPDRQLVEHCRPAEGAHSPDHLPLTDPSRQLNPRGPRLEAARRPRADSRDR